jgi:site-specific DNA-cytosine methylase
MASDINGHDILKRVYSPNGKAPTLNSMGGGNREPKVEILGGAFRGRYYDENGKRTDHKESVAGKTTQHLEIRNDGKTNTLTTVQKDNVVVKQNRWRKLTVTECERLQTVPVGYTEGVSNTQRYKMLGNGWTVDVISHIFKGMTI